mgnify:CR=1 FL=1
MDDDGILKEFLVECAEGLGRLDQEFVVLEKDTNNQALIASIFRTIHTIKGTCGFLGLPKLESVAHGGEDVLSMMRDGKMPVTPEVVTILLEAVDTIKEILSHIESNGSEPAEEYNSILQKLKVLISGGISTPASVQSGQPVPVNEIRSQESGVRSQEKSLDSESPKQRAESSVGRGRLHPALPVEGDGRSPVIRRIR